MPTAITSTITEQSVWFITGCSTGFGRELAKQLLARGSRVVVTARDPQALTQFAGIENALVQKLDVTDPAEVAAAVRSAEMLASAISGQSRRERTPKSGECSISTCSVSPR
jgi:NAD(P)-dependent dehydrogenase (short-subunit alcohol dehydrogenase family)